MDEEPPRLRRQLVQAPAEDLRGEAVGEDDVVEGRFDVLDDLAVDGQALHLSLVLEEEGDGLDELEVLDVVAPHPRLLVEEGQARGEGVVDEERPEKPLGVAVDLQRLRLAAGGEDAVERRGPPLQLVDAPRLLAALVDGQDEAAVEELLVDLDRRRRQEDHHRPFDAVFLRDEAPGLRVLAGGGDRQLAFGLEELQGVAGLLRAFLLRDGEDLVTEALALAEVEERLPRQSRVLLALFLRDEAEDGFHERRLPRRRAGLDDDGERLVELSRDGREVGRELVGVLADEAAGLEVFEDAGEELRVPQEGEGLRRLLFAEEDGLLLRLERLPDALLLKLLGAAQELAEVALDRLFDQAQLVRGLLLEGGALTGRVEIEGVDEEAGERRRRREEGLGLGAFASDEDVELQDAPGEVLSKAPQAVAAITQEEDDLVEVGGGLRGCGW